jgi:hypothetical protein
MTPFLVGSYLTCEEYRAAPNALNTNNLVPGGDQAEQDAELAAIIARASRWIDSVARQSLYATLSSQNDSDVAVRSGEALLHAHQDRVKGVTVLSWGASWSALSTLTAPDCYIEENRVRARLSSSAGWSGALNLSAPAYGSVYVSWRYIAGLVSTRLVAGAQIGDTTLVVENPTGIVGVTTNGIPATYLRLTAGAVQNTYEVQSITGTLVTLVTPLVENWGIGTGVSEVPDDLKEAGILATTHYIKQRKGPGFTITSKGAQSTAEKSDGIGMELAQAEAIVLRYERLTP